jgi:branched-chain amino acid aminotransferase
MANVPRNRVGSEVYDEQKLGFGDIFTDHMLTIEYSADQGGWLKPEIKPLERFYFHPATMVLHYGQEVFEGIKAFAGPDELDILLFRPDMNIRRFNRSCRRMCIPPLDTGLFMDRMCELVRKDRDWVPKAPGTSLYIRPTIVATDEHLGVRPSKRYLFFIILSPVGAYYPEGFAPVKIMVTDKYVRACRGGVGEAKTGGNYAASLLAAEEAHTDGFTQVLWLNAVDEVSVEEVGTMNIFFRINDEVVTPALSGTILPGVTRASVIHLARAWDMRVSERAISIEEVVESARDGSLQEMFGTGTAAVISPVSHFRYKGEDFMVGDGGTGEVASKLFDEITGMQTGHRPDPFGWVVNVGKL